jgi:hypothetical protein
MCAEVTGGDFRQASPAAADLEHARAIGHAGFQQRAPDLRLLGRGQRTRQVAFEAGAGVAHRRVQPQRIERIAEVVMGVDVLRAAAARIAVQGVFEAIDQGAPPRAVDDTLERVAVRDQQLQQHGQVG